MKPRIHFDLGRLVLALLLPVALAGGSAACTDESTVQPRAGRGAYQDNPRIQGSPPGEARAARDMPGKGRDGEHKLARTH
jgi:hypothetical protein